MEEGYKIVCPIDDTLLGIVYGKWGETITHENFELKDGVLTENDELQCPSVFHVKKVKPKFIPLQITANDI